MRFTAILFQKSHRPHLLAREDDDVPEGEVRYVRRKASNLP